MLFKENTFGFEARLIPDPYTQLHISIYRASSHVIFSCMARGDARFDTTDTFRDILLHLISTECFFCPLKAYREPF